jgi:hypothetical protein
MGSSGLREEDYNVKVYGRQCIRQWTPSDDITLFDPLLKYAYNTIQLSEVKFSTEFIQKTFINIK